MLAFFFVIFLLALVLGWLLWWGGSKSVSDLTEQLMIERTERIADAVKQHMQGASAVLETAFPRGVTVAEDLRPAISDLISRFYAATTLYPDSSDRVYYANKHGQGLVLQRLVDGNAQLHIKEAAGAPRKFYLMHGIEGEAEYRFTEDININPHERIWYQQGLTAAEHQWTGVYLDFDSGELVNSRVRQVLDREGQVAGVVGTDIFMSGLSRFMQGLAVSQNSQTFIVEPDGQLVAASAIEHVQRQANGRYVRVNAAQSDEQLVSQAWLQLQQMLPGLLDDSTRSLTLDDVDGQRAFVFIRHIVDRAGLDWYVVLAVPVSDILGGVRHNVVWVMYCGVLVTLLVVPLGMIMLGRVAEDVTLLSQVVGGATGLGKDLSGDVYQQVRRKDEIGVLARSFRKMHKELLTDRLTGAASRSALEHSLSRLLALRRKSGKPFALLFVDLNKFKPLNDCFGHEVGDQALIEVATRMQKMLREQDMLARWGGDEFVIVLPDAAGLDTAVRVCERVQTAVARPLECCPSYQLSAAVGMALFPRDGRDIATLLSVADQAMYADKQAC